MKAMWKGNISFALINIPVKLYTATHPKDVSFNLLHKKCSTPLHYNRFCPTCNVNVSWEDKVRGFKYDKKNYVVITDEDIEKIPVKSSRSIDILRFIDVKDVEPVYYERSYYVEPFEGGERAYALLRETMKRTGQAALVKISFHEKEHVGLIRDLDGVLTLHTLYYADEVSKPEALNIPKETKLDEKELGLAIELIKHFHGDFNIGEYHDEFRDSLIELINAKIEGKELKPVPVEKPERVVNLMEALRKSVEKSRKEKAGVR